MHPKSPSRPSHNAQAQPLSARLGLAALAFGLLFLAACSARTASAPEGNPGAPALVAPQAGPDETWSSTSPDGAWVAIGRLQTLAGGEQQAELKVARADGSQEWTAFAQVLAAGAGQATPHPYRWSADGRALYFTNLPRPDGCAVFVNGSDLRRLDLATGEVTVVAPSTGLSLALSPDESTLAYVVRVQGVLELVLQDLASRTERRAALQADGSQAGNIVWSPDGSALMLTVALNPCIPHQWRQTVVRVDALELSQISLLTDGEHLFATSSWPEAELVYLKGQAGETAWMNAETGRLESGEG